ncbi:MAG: benzoate MFS transporter BenK, partial [uncultured Rubrobacteraceae bacterium]
AVGLLRLRPRRVAGRGLRLRGAKIAGRGGQGNDGFRGDGDAL